MQALTSKTILCIWFHVHVNHIQSLNLANRWQTLATSGYPKISHDTPNFSPENRPSWWNGTEASPKSPAGSRRHSEKSTRPKHHSSWNPCWNVDMLQCFHPIFKPMCKFSHARAAIITEICRSLSEEVLSHLTSIWNTSPCVPTNGQERRSNNNPPCVFSLFFSRVVWLG